MPDVDFVTGLASRATFAALLGQACEGGVPGGEFSGDGFPVGESAGDESLAAVVCDVVGLKAVNERDGFAAGDACLRAAADRLRDAARGARLTARLGGDELVAVFLGPAADALARAAARTLAARGTPPLRVAAGARMPGEGPGPFVDRLYASLRRS